MDKDLRLKTYRLKLLILVTAFLIFGSVYACPSNPIPLYLLGKNAYKQEIDFWEFLAVVDVAPSPDSELLEVEGTWESWFIVDKNRNYCHLSACDGVIKSIFVDDKCLISKGGVKVGDTFSSVMSTYPRAKRKPDEKILKSDFFELFADDGKVVFWFSSRVVRDMIKDGYQVDLNDEVVRQSRVFAITILH